MGVLFWEAPAVLVTHTLGFFLKDFHGEFDRADKVALSAKHRRHADVKKAPGKQSQCVFDITDVANSDVSWIILNTNSVKIKLTLLYHFNSVINPTYTLSLCILETTVSS